MERGTFWNQSELALFLIPPFISWGSLCHQHWTSVNIKWYWKLESAIYAYIWHNIHLPYRKHLVTRNQNSGIDVPSGIDFSVSWIIYLSPLLWISLWRSSVLKRTRTCLFCKLLRILVPCHKYFVETLCYDKLVPGIGDRGVLGPRFVCGELPVQRWGWRSTLTLDERLGPAQNLPRREDWPKSFGSTCAFLEEWLANCQAKKVPGVS